MSRPSKSNTKCDDHGLTSSVSNSDYFTGEPASVELLAKGTMIDDKGDLEMSGLLGICHGEDSLSNVSHIDNSGTTIIVFFGYSFFAFRLSSSPLTSNHYKRLLPKPKVAYVVVRMRRRGRGRVN